MTTTTAKSEKANGAAAKKTATIEGEWEDAGKASGGEGSDVPAWAPQLRMFAPDVVEAKLSTLPEGSSAAKEMVGTLRIEKAYGEPRYFVDVPDAAGTYVGQDAAGKDIPVRRFAMPLHGILTSTLDCVRMTPPPRVRLEFMGESKRARAGQRAAFVYDVRVLPKDAILAKPRADALLPIHKENKKKRDEQSADDASADD